jgi:hypothetical protein
MQHVFPPEHPLLVLLQEHTLKIMSTLHTSPKAQVVGLDRPHSHLPLVHLPAPDGVPLQSEF